LRTDVNDIRRDDDNNTIRTTRFHDRVSQRRDLTVQSHDAHRFDIVAAQLIDRAFVATPAHQKEHSQPDIYNGDNYASLKSAGHDCAG